jgi:hypothetical protein
MADVSGIREWCRYQASGWSSRHDVSHSGLLLGAEASEREPGVWDWNGRGIGGGFVDA